MNPTGTLFSGTQMRAFGDSPQGALMFRQQHAWLRSASVSLLTTVEKSLEAESAAVAWSLATALQAALQIHKEFEIWHVRRTLAYDPKARTIAEQCDRDTGAALAEIAAMFRRFPCASEWVAGRGQVHSVLKAVNERLLASMALEEREVFPAYDRAPLRQVVCTGCLIIVTEPILQPVFAPPRTGRLLPDFLDGLGAIAVVDFEPTGPDPAVDRIVEVGIVRYEHGVRQQWSSLVNPQIPIPPTASAVHHYTDEHVKHAPSLAELADEIDSRLADALVVSHGTEFDSALLGTELGQHIPAEEWLCTYRLARHLYPLAPAFGNDVLRYWLKAHPDLPLRPQGTKYVELYEGLLA